MMNSVYNMLPFMGKEMIYTYSLVYTLIHVYIPSVYIPLPWKGRKGDFLQVERLYG